MAHTPRMLQPSPILERWCQETELESTTALQVNLLGTRLCLGFEFNVHCGLLPHKPHPDLVFVVKFIVLAVVEASWRQGDFSDNQAHVA